MTHFEGHKRYLLLLQLLGLHGYLMRFCRLFLLEKKLMIRAEDLWRECMKIWFWASVSEQWHWLLLFVASLGFSSKCVDFSSSYHSAVAISGCISCFLTLFSPLISYVSLVPPLHKDISRNHFFQVFKITAHMQLWVITQVCTVNSSLSFLIYLEDICFSSLI